MKTPDEVKAIVRGEYGQAARQAKQGGSLCCTSIGGASVDPIMGNLYREDETTDLPAEAVVASLGCGNPTALAELHEGETVLDLGSGAGLDVLLSARRVGPSGRVYGLDMTDEMLALARENQVKAGVTNVGFLQGEIEAIPLPDSSVDVIISNCVINLSPEKERVFREAFRVLKPGGRLAVSDIVVRRAIPADLRHSMELWAGCVAGALEEQDYRRALVTAGFEAVTIAATRVFSAHDAKEFLSGSGMDVEAMAEAVDGAFVSAFVHARKPLRA